MSVQDVSRFVYASLLLWIKKPELKVCYVAVKPTINRRGTVLAAMQDTKDEQKRFSIPAMRANISMH